MTWTQAKKACKSLGFTLRATGFGQEHVLFLAGTRNAMDHAQTYFTTCANDATESARVWRRAMDENEECDGDYMGV